jgi:hypothetical protein
MINIKKNAFLAMLALLAVLFVGVTAVMADGNPVVYNDWKSGNAADECGRIGDYDGAYKVDAAAPNGTYDVDIYGNKVTISNSNGKVFDWSSNFGIGAVIVKAGTGANVWFYDPQAKSDTGLYGYENRDISHVTFCWQYQLDVSKDAKTTFTRNFDWTIEKTADQTELTLSQGQQFDVNYTVKVTKDSGTDSDWAVSGEIRIENNTPVAFTVTKVEDIVSNSIAATVTCDLPTTLDPGDSLTCGYSTSLPDGSDRLNTATVTYSKTSGNDRTATATADVDFGDPTTIEDDCVDISDSYKGVLGNTCASQDFKYTRTIKANDLDCGENTIVNTAYLDSDDGVKEESEWTVTVDVACDVGCTLTQGYWKTHSKYGPAPYDDTWNNVAGFNEDTTFFSSGQTYYQVLWTAPQGNPYYILAHQYIAAKLNIANGASTTPEVSAAITWAESFFNTYKPSSSLPKAVANEAKKYATTLDNYNNGLIGPGHCSE